MSLQELNHELGVFICWIVRKHRNPHVEFTKYPWKVEICSRCGYIFKKEEIGPSFREILNDIYYNSGNQIW